MDFRLIPAGSVDADNKAVAVSVAKPFYLGVHEVTQAQYERVTGENPSHFRGPDLPVESVVWPEAVAFCRKLSELEGLAYRLPTESEWHLACRAGGIVTSCLPGDVGSHCWYPGNSSGQTHPVGLKRANAWGLYDMHGNVAEWCLVVPKQYPYPRYTAREESPPVARLSGGSWHEGVLHCGDHHEPSLGNRLPMHGFRVAVPLP